MVVTKENYHSVAANMDYWSVSQFKAFDKCEACGLAEAKGLYQREETDALLIGSYVDAYFSGELDEFVEEHRDQMIRKRGGGLLAKFQHANDIIDVVKRQPLMMDYLTRGDRQIIMCADLWGLPWKIKMDVFNGQRIVDLKTVKSFESIFDKGYGRRSWIEYWGYDVQGAVYQKVVEKVVGVQLPFYIVAVTKEKVPDFKVIQIPQHILDAALRMVEAKIDRFELIKTGLVDPIRCEECDYCKKTKVLREPEVYEIEEAS